MPGADAASIPIGIRELAVENFRGLRALELKFLDDRERASDVVLAGPNGGGKTAVLEACLLALGHPNLVRAAAGGRPPREGTPYRIVARLQTAGGIQERVATGDRRSPRGKPSSRPPQEPRPVPCLYFSSWRDPQLGGAVPVTAGQPGSKIPEKEWNRVLLLKQFLVNAKAHAALSQRPPAEGPSAYEEAVGRLDEVWRLFHPGREQGFLVEPVAEDPREGFDVFLAGPRQPRVPLDSLSSGELQLVALFGEFVRRGFREGVVLIAEPELHLDPPWHALLVRALRRFLPAAQLLVATHSPEVLDSVSSFQRHLLLPPDDPRNTAWKAKPRGSPLPGC
jgi:hypothetical protein